MSFNKTVEAFADTYQPEETFTFSVKVLMQIHIRNRQHTQEKTEMLLLIQLKQIQKEHKHITQVLLHLMLRNTSARCFYHYTVTEVAGTKWAY